MEIAEPNEPADPTDRIDPTLPIDRIEYADPIERMDPSDRIDRIELRERTDFFDRAIPWVYHRPRGSQSPIRSGYATVKKPTVGKKLHVRGGASAACVVSVPEITASTRPGPVSESTDSVAGPSGLILAALVSA